MKLGDSVRYSDIQQLIVNINKRNAENKLKKLEQEHFGNLNPEEIKETLDGSTIEEYFSQELEEMTSAELKEFGDEFSVGKTFLVIEDENSDAMATFVMTGYSSEGVFDCIYISPDAPEPFDVSKSK